MPTVSWNVVFIVIFAIGIAFGYILQREKIIATLFSVYVALVVSQATSGVVQQFLTGDKTVGQYWVSANASPFALKAAIFGLIIVLLVNKIDIANKSRNLLSPIEILIYSALTTCLVISSVFSFMPADRQLVFANASIVANIIITHQIYCLLAPIGMVILLGFFKGKPKE